jgi:hypothetical protein
MTQYRLVYKKGVKPANSLCLSIAAFVMKFIDDYPNLKYDGLGSLIQKIEVEQYDLRLNAPQNRCDKINIQKWEDNGRLCMAIYANYNVYCASKGPFMYVYANPLTNAEI